VGLASSPLAAAEPPPARDTRVPEAPYRTVAAGAGDWSLFWAPIDRQKTNSTNEQTAALDSATLAPPDPEVAEPNGKRGRRDLPLQPAAVELRSGTRGPRPSPSPPYPALFGETMALLESRAYANSSQHSVAARWHLLEDLVQRVARGQKRQPWPLTPEVAKGVVGSFMAADFRSAQNYLSELSARLWRRRTARTRPSAIPSLGPSSFRRTPQTEG
jgi:hypothetical protein